MQTTDELFNIEITGETVEFKMNFGQDVTSNLPQAIANMVRVARSFTTNALRVGKILCSIIIYGLLVSYDKAMCVPLKYSLPKVGIKLLKYLMLEYYSLFPYFL